MSQIQHIKTINYCKKEHIGGGRVTITTMLSSEIANKISNDS